MVGQPWPLLRWMLLVQSLLTLLAAGVTALIVGPWKGLFVILGGCIAMGVGLIFALRSFSVDAASDPIGALRAMRRGMTAKMIAAMVIFMLAAKWLPQYAAQIIIGYAAATVSYWIALIKAPLVKSGQSD